MTDKEMYAIIQDFARNHTLAKDIEVSVSSHNTSMKPRFGEVSCRYEDAEMLSSLIRGATHFMMWARRAGKVRLVKGIKRGR